MFLTEDEEQTYSQCRGRCGACLYSGDCSLEDKLDDDKKDQYKSTDWES
jgi:hypothetical protein